MERNVYLEDIPLPEALERIEQGLVEIKKQAALEVENIPLADALGRVTAEPVFAKISSPHFHAAAMDGYAVNAADTREATETRPVTLKAAHPVNTGDPIPPEADAVIMIENVQTTDDGIQITAPVAPRQHVRMMGEDMVATELVLPANHMIRPVDLGALAGCGFATVPVRRKPHVVIIPTGSELITSDRTPEPGQLIEYNSLVLGAQVEQWGGRVTRLAITADEPEKIRSVLQQAIDQKPDMVLLLSGTSAGSKDYGAHLIKEEGNLLVHGVAVRPGHPVIAGTLKDTLIIGVPGYPVSAALTGELFVQPFVRRWLGLPPDPSQPRVKASITRRLVSPTGDDDYVRVSLAQVGDRLLATPLKRGAGVITSLVRADGLAHVPRFVEGAEQGEEVDVILYRDMAAIRNTIMAIGSHDPMLDLFGQYIARHYPVIRLASANVGSMGGLVALKRGEAHLAGVHLLDAESGEYNIPEIKRRLANVPVKVVTFAEREQGLIVAAGNPEGVQGIEDLTRLRFVNRQPGAGTRLLLDHEMGKRGIDPAAVKGYDHEQPTHMAVAAAVASNVADCGLGVRSAALALGLDFISVGWERYDLVIPMEHSEHPGIVALLDVLTQDDFKAALSEQPGYRTGLTGTVQYESS